MAGSLGTEIGIDEGDIDLDLGEIDLSLSAFASIISFTYGKWVPKKDVFFDEISEVIKELEGILISNMITHDEDTSKGKTGNNTDSGKADNSTGIGGPANSVK